MPPTHPFYGSIRRGAEGNSQFLIFQPMPRTSFSYASMVEND
jgi:hypothetical protein